MTIPQATDDGEPVAREKGEQASPHARPASTERTGDLENGSESSAFAGFDSADPEARQEIIDEVTARSVVTDPL